jgi:hypothetical protein
VHVVHKTQDMLLLITMHKSNAYSELPGWPRNASFFMAAAAGVAAASPGLLK